MKEIKLNGNKRVFVDNYPNECPFCRKTIEPEYLTYNDEAESFELIFRCPSSDCKKSFVALYIEHPVLSENYNFYDISKVTIIKIDFPPAIQKTSKEFEHIYNQSLSAEHFNLFKICGVGYRKALEFLIKDYLIIKNPTKEKDIKDAQLGKCIEQYIKDPKIKLAAKRAIWIGNDETHYLRTWPTKDIKDLKKLIDLTVNWIEMERLSDELETDMPE